MEHGARVAIVTIGCFLMVKIVALVWPVAGCLTGVCDLIPTLTQ